MQKEQKYKTLNASGELRRGAEQRGAVHVGWREGLEKLWQAWRQVRAWDARSILLEQIEREMLKTNEIVK